MRKRTLKSGRQKKGRQSRADPKRKQYEDLMHNANVHRVYISVPWRTRSLSLLSMFAATPTQADCSIDRTLESTF